MEFFVICHNQARRTEKTGGLFPTDPVSGALFLPRACRGRRSSTSKLVLRGHKFGTMLKKFRIRRLLFFHFYGSKPLSNFFG